MKKIILFSILVIIVLLSFLFFQHQSTPETQPLKIGINVWPGYAHAFIAQEKGFFNKHGVAVELILKPEISEINQLYNKNELDGLFNVFTDIIMLNANGIPTRVVYISDYSDTGDVIIGRSEFNSIQDLKGKTVSFEGVGTFSQMLVASLLQKANIQEGEFKTVNLPAHDVLNALELGTIDAGHTWEPTTSQLIAKGYKVLAKAGDIPGIIADILAFHADVIKNRPQEVQAVVKAMLEAEKFIISNLDEALDIMAKKENMSKAEMQAGIEGVHFLNQTENRDAMQSEQGSLFKSGKKAADFYLKNGQLFKNPDFWTETQ
ncbi:MAG: ABC transporter substrate-binding protein, partial [Candidatus Marithrix sp.]